MKYKMVHYNYIINEIEKRKKFKNKLFSIHNISKKVETNIKLVCKELFEISKLYNVEFDFLADIFLDTVFPYKSTQIRITHIMYNWVQFKNDYGHILEILRNNSDKFIKFRKSIKIIWEESKQNKSKLYKNYTFLDNVQPIKYLELFVICKKLKKKHGDKFNLEEYVLSQIIELQFLKCISINHLCTENAMNRYESYLSRKRTIRSKYTCDKVTKLKKTNIIEV